MMCDETKSTRIAAYLDGCCCAPEDPSRLIIYTDGSCSANGYVGAKAGAGIYFGPKDSRNASFRVPGDQTNNRGEVYAIIQALRLTAEKSVPVEIRTDSKLTINCATKVYRAQANLDLYRELWQRMDGRDIVFTWVKGHNKDPGNEAADKLAKAGAQMQDL